MRFLTLGLIIGLILSVVSEPVDGAQGSPNSDSRTTAQPDPNAVNSKSPPNRSLGVLVNDTQRGVEVSQVNENSAASHAGLQIGDRITSVDGRPIGSHRELIDAIRSGDRQSGLLLIARNGVVKRLPINWTTGAVRRATGYRGLHDATKFNGTANGVRIIEVVDGSWAQTSGLRPNDRIVSVNRTPVTSMAHLAALLEDSAGSVGKGEMVVDRAGVPTTLELHLPQPATGPGSLSDMSTLIGTRGDVAGGTGNIGRLGPFGIPNRSGSTNGMNNAANNSNSSSSDTPSAGAISGGLGVGSATAPNGTAGTLGGTTAPGASLGTTSPATIAPNAATAPGQTTTANGTAQSTAQSAGAAAAVGSSATTSPGNVGSPTGSPAVSPGGAAAAGAGLGVGAAGVGSGVGSGGGVGSGAAVGSGGGLGGTGGLGSGSGAGGGAGAGAGGAGGGSGGGAGGAGS